MNRCIRWLVCLLFSLLLSQVARALPVGSGVGTVKDNAGASVVGASLTLIRISTNAKLTTSSDTEGQFQFPNLAPDIYALSVEASGFKRATLSQIVVEVDHTTRMDVTLEPGSVDQVMNVDAGAPMIETQQNTLINVVDKQAISRMPLNSRSFLDLALLTPGSAPSAAASQVVAFTVAGARTQSNTYWLDGVSNMDIQTNGGLTNFRITDAVQEFSVQTSVSTAEFGRGQGGQINVLLRSGSNQLHGTVFEYFRNTVLNGTDYFVKLNKTKKPVLNRNQFGGTLGGPVWKDKMFLFGSYEGFRQIAPTISSVLVPTQAQRNSVTDPSSKNLLQFFPLANTALNGGTNYTSNVANSLSDDTGLVRADANVGTKDHLAAHYVIYNGRTNVGGPTPLSGGYTDSPISKSFMFEDDHTFTSNTVNTIRFGFSANGTNVQQQDRGLNAANIITDANGTAIPGVVDSTANLSDSGLPTITISGGYPQLGSSATYPQGRNTRSYELIDTVSIANPFGWHAHLFKMGVQARRDDARRFIDTNARGTLSFTSFSDFASGLINSSTVKTGSSLGHFRRYPVYLFFQDQYTVTPHLTLNYGIRYELPSSVYEINGLGANLVPGQGITTVGTNSVLDIDTTKTGPASIISTQGAVTLPKSAVYPDHNNIAPVFGFAYSPVIFHGRMGGEGSTVLRGGFRVGYDDIFFNMPTNLRLNAPFGLTTTQTANVTQPGKFGYATAFSQQRALVSNAGAQAPGKPTVGVITFNALDPHIRNSYNYAYNLSLEQKLSSVVSIELDYIGSLGRKLGLFLDPNQPNVVVNNASVRGALAPNEQIFPYNHYGAIAQGANAVSSSYNGAIATLKYRGPAQTSLQASYTYSRTLDYNSAYYTLGKPSSSRNLKAEYGNSANDLRHRLVLYYLVPLPIGPGHRLLGSNNVISREAFEGWTVNGITEVQSGVPFTVYLGNTDYSGFNQFADRPNTGAGKLKQHNKTPSAAFDTTYFSTIGAGAIGTERRNQYYGAGLVNFDLSATKDFFIISDRYRLQFRSDLFNLFNHTNFSAPIATYTSSSFGKITSTVGGATSGATGGVRLAQFSLRFSF